LPSVEENVPANSSAEQELVASPYGQLLTEPGQRNGGANGDGEKSMGEYMRILHNLSLL